MDMMGKVIAWGMVAVALAGTFAPDMLAVAGGAALLLVLLGLVSGYMNQIDDV